MLHRYLTRKEISIHGLQTGEDALLEVRTSGAARRGVFATEEIKSGSWLCEYKGIVYPLTERAKHTNEYDLNGEESYIISSQYSVPGKGRLCWDATRILHQLGRYMNHTTNPNASLTAPVHVRGKWRIGFVAMRDISRGDEVMWDYGVRGEEQGWEKSQLVGGQLSSQPGPSGYNPMTEQPVVRLYFVTIAVSNFMLYRSLTQTVTPLETSFNHPAPFPYTGKGKGPKRRRVSTLSTPLSHIKIAIQVIVLSSSDEEDEVTTKKRKVSAIKRSGSVPQGCTFPHPTPPC